MIGFPGFGLGVEGRKRVTIGVELAAKPQLLLFLDGALSEAARFKDIDLSSNHRTHELNSLLWTPRTYLWIGWTECVQHCAILEEVGGSRPNHSVSFVIHTQLFVNLLRDSRLISTSSLQVYNTSAQCTSFWKFWSSSTIKEGREMCLLWRHRTRLVYTALILWETWGSMSQWCQSRGIHVRGDRFWNLSPNGRW